MPKITFLPFNITVEAKIGESVLEAAEMNNIPLEHACGGNCACATCHVIVEHGMENLSVMEEAEEDRLDEAEGLTLKSRLGCQAKLKGGDIVITIPK